LQAEQNQSNPLADQQFAPNLISLVSLPFHPVLPKFGAKMVTLGIKVLCHVNCHRLRMRWLLLADPDEGERALVVVPDVISS
jgi:hypothetical protein